MTIATSRPKGSVIVAAFLLLVLASPQALANNDRMIQQAIEEAAANTPELRGTGVRVAVGDRRVVLFGSVRLFLHRLLYEKIAWQTIGVVEVDNEIRVVPRVSSSDAAIERKIWEIIRAHEQFHMSDFRVVVKRGGVSLDGTFGQPLDVIFLRKRVAAIEGVVAIDIEVGFRV
jgi:osmotically-inducible protein OsmY